MTVWDSMLVDFKKMMEYGQKISIQYYVGGPEDGDFDDNINYVKSGTTVWDSGLVLPMTSKFGSQEAVLIEQGKLKSSDNRIFIPGDVVTSGLAIKIGVGSPTPLQHSVIPDGITAYPPTGTIVYKKLYTRVLPTGSFKGEQ